MNATASSLLSDYARSRSDASEPRIDDALLDALDLEEQLRGWRDALANAIEVVACRVFVLGADLAVAIRGAR